MRPNPLKPRRGAIAFPFGNLTKTVDYIRVEPMRRRMSRMKVKWGGAMYGANRPDVSEKGRCDVEAESLVWERDMDRGRSSD